MKVIIIGDSGVGKTSLLESFNYKKISKSAKPTIGAEFLKKKVSILVLPILVCLLYIRKDQA